MRLFTGIAPSPEVAKTLALAAAPVAGIVRPAAGIRLSPPSNYHVTTRFIGTWQKDRLTVLDEKLAAIPKAGVFEVQITGLSFFPTAAAPKVLYAGVESGEPLHMLARETERAVTSSGGEPVARPWSPHLTLACLKIENIEHWSEHITPSLPAHMPATTFGSFPVTEFHLYLSEPGPHGSVYTRLRTYPTC